MQPHQYQVGDWVWVERLGVFQPNPKLSQKWEEAIVLKISSDCNLKVNRYNRAKNKVIVVHVNKVRPMLSATPPDGHQTIDEKAITEVDPRDLPILNKLYAGCATQEDVHNLMQKGYVIIFPHGTILPTLPPTPGPRLAIPSPQGINSQNNNDPDRTMYTWRRQTPIRRKSTQSNPPEQSTTTKPNTTPTPPAPAPVKDKLTQLAKQLAIPKTSTFEPAVSLPGRNLRHGDRTASRRLTKLANRLLTCPTALETLT